MPTITPVYIGAPYQVDSNTQSLYHMDFAALTVLSHICLMRRISILMQLPTGVRTLLPPDDSVRAFSLSGIIDPIGYHSDIEVVQSFNAGRGKP